MRCIEMLIDPSTYLCFKCQKLLLKHHSLEEELASVTIAKFEVLFGGVYTFSDNVNSHTESGSSHLSQPTSTVQATSTAQPSTNSPEVSVRNLHKSSGGSRIF